ncbi:MAG: Uma2 family endonuclease, partial [Bacteroidota bacterium]
SIELFHGWLVWQKMTNAKERGAVVNIHDFIRPFARKIGFGKVFNDQTECIMADGATLIPDASLISWQRWREIMRPHGPNDRPVFMGAPELVIEARSPSNTRKEERTKRTQYFANGTQIVWDVDDAQQKIWVYHASAPNNPVEYGIGDEIKCELLPGWKRSVAHIFAEEEVPMEAIAGEIIEDSREEGIAIGARNAIIGVLPMLAQLRFGEELPDDVSQQLQALDLATLQSLQASVQTSPDMETWLAQIS